MGRGQGPHLHEQDFGRTNQGDRWGSPAPDKGHDRLAARCTVDSHIPYPSSGLSVFFLFLQSKVGRPRGGMKAGRRLVHHTPPLLKIPVWWRRAVVLPSLPSVVFFLSFICRPPHAADVHGHGCSGGRRRLHQQTSRCGLFYSVGRCSNPHVT